MKRSLILALLASLCLHAYLILSVPVGQGWAAGHTARTAPIQASLRLPTLSIKTTAAEATVVNQGTENREPPPALPAEEAPADTAQASATTAIGLPFQEEARPFESSDLTERPAAIDALSPELEKTLPPGSSGLAILILEIDETGTVVSVTPENSAIAPDSLEKISAAFKAMRFLPGRIGKTPVKARMRLEVTIDDLRSELGGQSR
jgi:hypothetical protein